MNDDNNELLRIILDRVEENNEILRDIKRGENRRKFFKTFYWLIIIFSGIYLWTFVQPYYQTFLDFYNQMGDIKEKIDSNFLNNLINK